MKHIQFGSLCGVNLRGQKLVLSHVPNKGGFLLSPDDKSGFTFLKIVFMNKSEIFGNI
jgi:hypothetical protein